MEAVAALKAGNTKVFEEIYHEYHHRFYCYVLKNTGSEELAEEVTQLTFIKLWEKRAGLSDQFSVEVQLARMCRSLYIDALRKKAVERKALQFVQPEEADHTDVIAYKELQKKIAEAVSTLPPGCLKIYQLSREEGLSHAEIARQLSISPKTVENQISKALKIVRHATAVSIVLLYCR